MKITDEIQLHPDDFVDLCRKNKVSSLYAFGSAVTDRFNNQTSDIDLLIDIDEPDPIEKGEKLLELWDAFEIFFNRKVDLLTESSIRNPFLRKNIENSKVLIYDGSRIKISF